MTTETVALDVRPAARPSAWRWTVLGFAVGVAGLALAAVAFLVGLSVAYEGRILPGVRVSGVALAGLDRTAAETKLRQALPTLGSGRLTLVLGPSTRTITYSAIHRDYDMPAILDAAFAIGRSESPLERAADEVRGLLRGSDVVPVARYDGAAAVHELEAVAAALKRPAVDASVVLDADGTFAVRPGHDGVGVDEAAGLAAIDAALAGSHPNDATVQLAPVAVPPTVTTQQASAAALQGIVLSVFDLTVSAGPVKSTIPASTVRSWIVFELRTDGTLGAVFDPKRIETSLAPLASKVAQPTRSARFTTDGARVTSVVPAVEGRTLDVPGSAAQIADDLQNETPSDPVSEVKLALTAVTPRLSTIDAQAIAPHMVLISQWTTHFFPSEHNFWGKNIAIPTTQIDGYVLMPGDWFDFWKVVNVSADLGFGPGGAIINGHSEPTGALGGGICSCSTTLFNAAVRAGLQIGARANHYYYITRYPVGLDATVFKSDGGYTQTMSFRNDTPNPILVRGFNAVGRVTFQVYGVPFQRKVTFSVPIIKNYSRAWDTVQYTTSMRPGTSRRIEYPTDGFDAWVTRTVVDLVTGKVIHQETWYSHYQRITGLLLIGGSKPAPPPSPTPKP